MSLDKAHWITHIIPPALPPGVVVVVGEEDDCHCRKICVCDCVYVCVYLWLCVVSEWVCMF